MKTLTLVLPLPPGVNNLYVNVPRIGRRKSKGYRTWIKAATASLWTQKPAGGFPLFERDFSIVVAVPLTMRGDADGRLKAPIDFLKKPGGIISDDRHAQGASISRSADVAPGTCKITVYETPARAA